MLDRRMRRRIGQPPHGDRAHQHQERPAAISSGTAPMRSASEAAAMPISWPMNCSAVASATARGRLRPRHRRQKRVAGRHGEGADRSCRQAVGDQQRIAEAAHRQHAGQHQRRHGIEQVVAQQQAARVAAVGDQPAQRQEQDAGRHQRHLGDADGEGVHVQHDRGQPGEQHLLDAERHEPAAQSCQIDGKGGKARHGGNLPRSLFNYILQGVSAACSSNSQRAQAVASDPSEARR